MVVQVGGAGRAGSHHTHRDRGHQNGEDDGVAKGEWRGPGDRRGRCGEKVGCAHHGSAVGTTG